MLTDAALVALAADGSDEAFDQLVSRHRTTIYLLARSRVGCREAALDLAQEVFVQAYISIRRLRDPAAFGAWLRGITVNLCRMHVRGHREVPTADDALQQMLERRTPRAHPAETAVWEALDALTPATRSAAVLRFVEELSLLETAEVLGISLPAAKSRVREARLRLREEMVEMARRTARPERPGAGFNRELAARLALARWYRDFSDYIDSGISLVSALQALASADFPEPIREATVKLSEAVQGGETMSRALGDLPALQAPGAIGMVRMGEVGGNLEWTARFLADWLDVENSRRDLEVAFWCASVGSIVQAGVPVRMALETSLGVTLCEPLRGVVSDMAAAVESGELPSAVLERAGNAVPPMVVVCAQAGTAADCFGWALQLAAAELNAGVASRLVGTPVPHPRTEALSPRLPLRPFPSLGKAECYSLPPGDVRAAFTSAVCAILHAHAEPTLRAAAAHLLSRLPSESGAAACIDALGDADAGVRAAAIGALAAVSDEAAVETVAGRLDDPRPAVRRAAIEGLVVMSPDGAAERIAICMGDPDERVASTAIRALEALGALDALTRRAIDLLASEASMHRARAVDVLESHPVPGAAEPLAAALQDEARNVRWPAARALAALGRKEAVPVLLEGVAAPWRGMVRPMARALALVGDASAAPAVRKALDEGRLPPSEAWILERLEEGR